MNKLKYLGYSIVCQEIPDEVSLAINVSGCPHKCEGCHSKYLWEYEGHYISDDLEALLQKYKGLITCVCFMGDGGEQLTLLDYILESHQQGLKVCLYTGADKIVNTNLILLCGYLDYIKIGHYESERGGLSSKTTNQRMYKIEHHFKEDCLIDITHKFWKDCK